MKLPFVLLMIFASTFAGLAMTGCETEAACGDACTEQDDCETEDDDLYCATHNDGKLYCANRSGESCEGE